MPIEDPKNLMVAYMSCDGRPHLNMKAFAFLEKIVNPNISVMETGMGSSTVWFAERVKNIVSFEKNKDWYHLVHSIITAKGLKNADLRFDPTYPTQGPRDIEGPFDLAFIDGRGRALSMMRIYSYIKLGGYILLDDSWRPRYAHAKNFLDKLGWGRQDFLMTGKSTATVWNKGIQSQSGKRT